MDCERQDKKRFFASGFRLNRILRNLNSCLTDLRNVLPMQPRNRKLSIILENLRDARDDITIEYSKLIEDEMEIDENGRDAGRIDENVNVKPVTVNSSVKTAVDASTQTVLKLI